MKVRWTEDSLRLRITPTELDALCCDGSVEASLTFPFAPESEAGVRWRIVLRAEAALAAAEMRSDAADSALVLVAAADVARLCEPDREGIYFTTRVADGRQTRFYVEKDFPCVHPRAGETGETKTETFPAPADFESRKA